MKKLKKISFASNNNDFTSTLNKRVNHYFKDNEISRHANTEMVVKTVVMFALYFVPYTLIVTQLVTNVWLTLGLVIVMAFGLAGIGLSVMHDGNHGAYAKKRWINTLVGYSLNLIGANSFNWKMQHNVFHHTYTNVHDHDEDINSRGVLRLTPDEEWKGIHRYQFIYAWFLYGLMTVVWMFFKDFERLTKYQKMGMLEKNKTNPTREWMILAFTKVIYIGYIFVIPLTLTSWVWWQVILGIVIMHYITGFILAIIFQPAHVIEGTEYPKPDDENMLENARSVHQLHTTTNFANKSRVFTWLVGGLNFQIEHHLFPNVCHVHYRKISKIVKSTAAEFGVPYKSAGSFAQALKSHMRLLRKLGMKPA